MKKKRKTKNIYDKHLTLDNLYSCWNIVKKTCKNKKEIYYFSLNLNTNIYSIYKELKERTYKPNKYKCFMIFEPKARLVMSQSIRDKIVNHFITNYYLIPYLDSSLIDSNVATRKNKGTSYANKLLIKYINKIIINNKPDEIYVLKIDIHKYFYNIDHFILIDKLKHDLYDIDVINLIYLFLKETNNNYINNRINYYNKIYNTDIPLYMNNKGLSIGAMCSQFLAIYLCNDLHHYIKQNLRCKYFITYMDDYLFIDTNKDRLKYIYRKINSYLNKLNLSINKKSNIYRVSNGFNFLGYKYIYKNNNIIKKYNKKTYHKIITKLNYLKDNNIVKYKRSLASYNGYLKLKGVVFKMKIEELYNNYKQEYNNYIIIIKEGIFYKCLNQDGKIIWYLFNYKYNNNISSFGNYSYDKVIDKLKELDIPFIIIDKNSILLTYKGNIEVYNSYLNLSIIAYNKYELEEEIIDKIKNISSGYYKDISEYLDELINKEVV